MTGVVVLRGADDFQIMIDNSFTREDEEYFIDNDTIVFLDQDITVGIGEAYSYIDVDPYAFLAYLRETGQIDQETGDPIFIASRAYPYEEDMSLIPGLGVVYVFDGGEIWHIYSYIGVLQRDGSFYHYKLEAPKKNERYDFVIDQVFDSYHPSFSLIEYSKDVWTIDRFKDWCELNGFEYTTDLDH